MSKRQQTKKRWGHPYRLFKRIRARALRRCGELLKQIEPQHGANQNIGEGTRTKVLTREDAARDAGMSKHQQVQAVRCLPMTARRVVGRGWWVVAGGAPPAPYPRDKVLRNVQVCIVWWRVSGGLPCLASIEPDPS